MIAQKLIIPSLFLFFLALLAPVYWLINTNKEGRIEMVLEKHRQHLYTHVQSFLHNQNDLADLIFDQTVSDAAVMRLFEEAYGANESRRAQLRAQLIAMLEARYRIYRKQNVLQYHFVFADGTVFLRMHKKERFGDVLHPVREDFKTVNEEQRIVRGFVQGRTAHGFRNVYPLYGTTGKHIGALEVSFASELLQDHLTLSSKIHSHFLVHQEVVNTRAWQRDDRVITYAPSMEHPHYLSHTPLNHQSAECLQNNPARIAALQESILQGMAKGLPFALYSAEGDLGKVIGFYPIHHAITNRVVAWIVSYEDEPLIRNIHTNAFTLNVSLTLLLLLITLYIYRLLRQRLEMRRLNERFELVLEAINDGIWDWDIPTNSVYFSPQWKAMLGYELFDNRPERFFELIHPEDKTRVQEALEAHHRDPQNTPYHLQVRLRCQDGRYKWILIRGKTILDNAGKPTRMVGSHTDIDAMYRLQQDLAKHQKLLQSVFDLMAIGVSITDEQGNIIECNRASESILGITKEEHLRRQYQGPYWQIIDEHQRPLSAEAYTSVKALTQKRAFSNELMGIVRPEGIRWIEVSADYLGLEGYGVAIVFVDVTNYKAALSKAQQLQTKFYTLFEESLDAICLIDPETQRIIEFNSRAHKMLGYSREEYAALRIEQIDATEDKMQVTQRVERLFSDQAVRFSTQHRCKDGSLKDVQVNLRLLQIEDTPLIHATFHDVTELEDAKRALQEASARALSASRSKSEFLANMSHEIRTPLGGVIGLIELTLKTDLGTKQRDYLQKSLNSAHALLRILNDILDYSKIEAGKLELESRPFELAEVLRTVKDLFGYQAQRKGLAFSVVAPPSCRLIGDALRLTQVLSNLVGNAVKFTHQGAITLSAAIVHQSDERMQIDFSVKDSGIGMNEATQRRLFGSFHQADSSITREYGGSGLGLAISRQLVELMGGSIRVSSIQGVGSTFAFTLSLEIDHAARTQKPSESTDSTDLTAIAGARILLVEDNLINQLVATEMLSDFNVDVAQNGEEAVAKAASAPYDLILMDLQMPVMDGFEASRRIRASGNTTPIVALSAAVMQEDIIRSEEAGMNAHLSKPIEPEQLSKTLLQFISPKEAS